MGESVESAKIRKYGKLHIFVQGYIGKNKVKNPEIRHNPENFHPCDCGENSFHIVPINHRSSFECV